MYKHQRNDRKISGNKSLSGDPGLMSSVKFWLPLLVMHIDPHNLNTKKKKDQKFKGFRTHKDLAEAEKQKPK